MAATEREKPAGRRFGPWVLCCFLAAALVPAEALAEAERAALVVLWDHSRDGSVRALRRELEEALEAHGGLARVSSAGYRRNARRAGVPVQRWDQPRVIPRLSDGLELSWVLAGHLERRGRAYQVRLEAFHPDTGELAASAVVELPRARLDRGDAERLLTGLWQRLHPPEEAPPPPVVEAPKEDALATPAEEVIPAFEADWAAPALDFEDVDAAPTGLVSKIEVGGRVEAHHDRYTEDQGAGVVAGSDSIEVALRAKAGNDQAAALGEIALRRDFADPSRNRFDVTEAYTELALGRLTIRAGRLIVAWGAASLMNPTDILNPLDLRDPLRTEKLGAWMLRGSVLLGPLLLEGYYLPVPEASLLPLPTGVDAEGRFTGTSRWLTGRLETPPGMQTTFNLTAPNVPSPRLNTSQGGFRAAMSVGGVDVSAAWIYLFDRMPVSVTQVTPLGPTELFVDVAFEHRRMHVLTLDAETTLGKVRLAGEVAATLPKRAKGADPEAEVTSYLVAVGGLDYRTPQFLIDHTVHFFLELMTTQALEGDLADDPLSQLRFPVENAVLARVSYEMGSRMEAALELVESLDERGEMFSPSLAWTAGDMVKLRGGLVWLDGDSDGFFGSFSDNKRLFLEVEASF